MPAVRLPAREHAKGRRGIAHSLSGTPAFSLHTSSSSDRRQVEQYIFDRFRANHGATVRDFMPLLLTTDCKAEQSEGGLCAAAGLRPAATQVLFLEQYLPEVVEKSLSSFTGQNVERRHVVEVGNLVATRRGSSQLLFLILAAALYRAGYEWIVCTTTPQVEKTINRMGFEPCVLGDADPSTLGFGRLTDWGSYYDSRPRVVAGNIAEAVTVLGKRKTQAHLIAVYKNRIDALAIMIRQNSHRHDQHSFAA